MKSLGEADERKARIAYVQSVTTVVQFSTSCLRFLYKFCDTFRTFFLFFGALARNQTANCPFFPSTGMGWSIGVQVCYDIRWLLDITMYEEIGHIS